MSLIRFQPTRILTRIRILAFSGATAPCPGGPVRELPGLAGTQSHTHPSTP